MANLYESLVWANGQINPSGIKTKIFYIEKDAVVTFPKPTQAPVDATGNVSLEGDFVLKAGSYFKEIYSTQGKGKVWFENLGEKDMKMFKNKGLFRYPDINDAGKSMAKQFVNANCIFIAQLPHETESRFVVIGDADYDSMSTINGDSGDEPGSNKGLTIEIEVPCTTPLPNYKGTLEVADGSWDCTTGIFTANPI